MSAAPAHVAATRRAPQQNRKRAPAKPRQRAGGQAITLLTVVCRPVGGRVLCMFSFLFRVGVRAPLCAGRAAKQKERRPQRNENQRQREAKPKHLINDCACVRRPVGGRVFDMFSFVSCGGVRVRLRVGRAALEKELRPQRTQNKTGRSKNVCSLSGVSVHVSAVSCVFVCAFVCLSVCLRARVRVCVCVPSCVCCLFGGSFSVRVFLRLCSCVCLCLRGRPRRGAHNPRYIRRF